MQFDLLGKAVRRFRLPTVDYTNAPVIIIPVQEGDVNTRYFEITLYDDKGDMDLSIYTKALLCGSTPSGITLVSRKCEISEDGKSVIVQFGGGFTAQSGRVTCDINFSNNDESLSFTSQAFYVIVSESQAGKIITENNEEYNELLQLLKEVSGLENNISEAEGKRINAENLRASQEEDRQQNEESRSNSEYNRETTEIERDARESVRQSNESTRERAETHRISTEDSRVAAEKQRVADFVGMQNICNETFSFANEALSTSNIAFEKASNAETTANKSNTIASNAKEQASIAESIANTAKTVANTAKTVANTAETFASNTAATVTEQIGELEKKIVEGQDLALIDMHEANIDPIVSSTIVFPTAKFNRIPRRGEWVSFAWKNTTTLEVYKCTGYVTSISTANQDASIVIEYLGEAPSAGGGGLRRTVLFEGNLYDRDLAEHFYVSKEEYYFLPISLPRKTLGKGARLEIEMRIGNDNDDYPRDTPIVKSIQPLTLIDNGLPLTGYEILTQPFQGVFDSIGGGNDPGGGASHFTTYVDISMNLLCADDRISALVGAPSPQFIAFSWLGSPRSLDKKGILFKVDLEIIGDTIRNFYVRPLMNSAEISPTDYYYDSRITRITLVEEM